MGGPSHVNGVVSERGGGGGTGGGEGKLEGGRK